MKIKPTTGKLQSLPTTENEEELQIMKNTEMWYKNRLTGKYQRTRFANRRDRQKERARSFMRFIYAKEAANAALYRDPWGWN